MLRPQPLPVLGGLVLAFAGSQASADCPEAGHCHFPAWIPPSSAAFDQVGKAVSMTDTYAVFGAPGDEAVYVYRFTGGGWVQDGYLTPPGGSSAEDFGESVHIDGTRIIVGAPEDDEGGTAAGAAYIFDRENGSWSLSDKLFTASFDEFDQYGTDVVVQGDVAFVGGPGVAGGGRVIMFRKLGGFWSSFVGISRADTGSFGFCLDLDGRDLIIGDWQDNDSGTASGAAYYYDLDGLTVSYRHKIMAPDGASNDYFGASLAVDSGFLVIGAYGDDDDGNSSGSVYFFEKRFNLFPDPPSYELNQKLTACDAEGSAGFGRSVEVSGRNAVVGAPFQATGGAMYSYLRSTAVFGDWDPTNVMTASGGAADDQLGWSVAVAGKRCIAGANFADPQGEKSGEVYLFTTAPTEGAGPCPCPRLAWDDVYGLGKPGLNGIPRIVADEPAYLGDTLAIDLINGLPGATPILLIGLDDAEIPFDQGTILVDIAKLSILPPLNASGEASLSAPLPDAVELCGLDFYFQYLFVDPSAAGAKNTAQSHGFRRSLGY